MARCVWPFSYFFLSNKETKPTGTSAKFASMMGSALEEFEKEYGIAFEKVTLVPLEGEGTIEKRVDKSVSLFLLDFCYLNTPLSQAIRQPSLKPRMDKRSTRV